MPKILVTAAFKFAVDGNHVIVVEPGEQEVSERCAEVAVEHLKVATWLDGAPPPDPAKVVLQVPVLPIVTAQPPLVAGESVPPAVATAAAPVKPATPGKPVTKPTAKPAAKPKAPAKPKAKSGGDA
jgi:hypothetical protein